MVIEGLFNNRLTDHELHYSIVLPSPRSEVMVFADIFSDYSAAIIVISTNKIGVPQW